MPIPCTMKPSLVLSEIAKILWAEIMAQPAATTITLRRGDLVLVATSLSESIDRVDVVEEAAATAERLARELRIARADIDRLELHLTVHDLAGVSSSPYRPMEKSAAERRVKRRSVSDQGAEVIDISELLWREQMNRARPTDGGAA